MTQEASFFALCDGKTAVAVAGAQDHKCVGDGDTGPNTGGMGAYSPAPVLTPEIEDQIMKQVMIPTVEGMAKEGCPFKGILFGGFMIKDGKVKTLEHNVRFGDPECQAVMMRLKSDLLKVKSASLPSPAPSIEIARLSKEGGREGGKEREREREIDR
jgi:phosphoribosylamine--glycine ligase